MVGMSIIPPTAESQGEQEETEPGAKRLHTRELNLKINSKVSLSLRSWFCFLVRRVISFDAVSSVSGISFFVQ
jgi:hypothetical protein